MHLNLEWRSFATLSADRQIGMTRGPIPWAVIDRYADRLGIVGDEFDRFANIIRSMDDAYLNHLRVKESNAKS